MTTVGPVRTLFKTIPTHEQIHNMHRDLRFHPSTTHNPTTISKDQVDSFNRCGYLKGIRILDDESVSKHRSLFDTYLATALAAGHSSSSLSSAHLKYPEVYDLMHHRTILVV